jgi:hypothetical protein
MTPPAGRYRYDAPTRTWHSGATIGQVVPVATLAARMAGGTLTSPGGIPDPPSNFVPFAAGTVRPNYAPKDGGVSNVGCRIPFSQLTQVGVPGGNSQFILSAGMNVSGLLIWGEIFVTGKGTMTDCIGRGANKPTTSSGIVRGSSRNLQGSLFQWCTFDATDRESPWQDGIAGGNYTARWCVITRSNDGLGASAPLGGGVAECCRIVDGYYTGWFNTATGSYYPGFPPAPSDYKTHGDGAQIQGYSGWIIRGCYIGGQPSDGWSTAQQPANRDFKIPAQLAFQQLVDSGMDYANSGIICVNGQGAGAPIGALIELNWLAGGAAFVNLNGTLNGDTLAGVTVRNNRFIPDARGRTRGGFKIFMADTATCSVTGNVWDDTDQLVTINLYGGGTRAQTS